MATKAKASVVVVGDGWIVNLPDEKGLPQYIGKDAFWSRAISVPVPFKAESLAIAQRDSLNDSRSLKWGRE